MARILLKGLVIIPAAVALGETLAPFPLLRLVIAVPACWLAWKWLEKD